ncbi:TRAP-type C4-dicarboxylate transport system, large permease component [hydrothermal vent metagenome]|uniref:TRAP-type C4-dicarboxylate transport system, large permease component n=1 Tax=hydrothermal vent metagenome TaxID=652676 RepID=A0A3B1A4V0_9ZZZZ
MISKFFLIIIALLGAPLFIIIAASAMIGFNAEDIDLAVMPIEIYRLADTPILIAIPLFTFAGYLLGESNASTRLVNITNALIGWLPGGLAIMALITCAIFTAFTGASGVTIVALGALLYPALKEAGYSERFNLGLITSSGSLGVLFAPSLPLILYGVVVQQLGMETVAIDDLFIAGLLPGFLMIIMLSIYSMMQKRHPGVEKPKQKYNRADVIKSLRAAAWEIPLPFVVLGGIYSGYFAVSEAAAITALYVFIVEVLILREISYANLSKVIRESMVMVGGILIILGVSLAMTNYMIDTEVPMRLFEVIKSHVDSKWTFLILLNIFLLILGMMLDIFSALVIIVPIIFPIAISYGINPIHLGIIFLANMQLGYFTPPVGMNLFIASYRFNRPVMELYRATIPYFLILFMAVLIITYWPGLTLFLLE